MKRVSSRAAAGAFGLLLFLGTAEGGEVARRPAGPGGGAGECGRSDGPVTIIDLVERRVVTIDPGKGAREERRFTDFRDFGKAARDAPGTSAGGSSGPGRDGAPAPRAEEPERSGEPDPAAPDGDGSVSYCGDGNFRIIVGGKAAREIRVFGKGDLEEDTLKVRKEIGKLLGDRRTTAGRSFGENREPEPGREMDALEVLREAAGEKLRELLDKTSREDGEDE
jgi:hypothetical protein